MKAIEGIGRLKRYQREARRALEPGFRSFGANIRCRYYLSACMCFRDAAPYLAEWLEFHRLAGVEHFYLYNNASKDDFHPVLDPYVRAGLVTLTDWGGNAQQFRIYDHCLRERASESVWIAFIDDDEFLFCPVTGDLRKLLPPFERYPGLRVAWHNFGFSGIARRRPGLVIENFVMRQEFTDIRVKSIVQPRRISRTISSHHFEARDGRRCVNELGEPSAGMFDRTRRSHYFRIHHYITKSLEELWTKVQRGRADVGYRHVAEDAGWMKMITSCDEVEDRSLQSWLPALKDALERPASSGGPVEARISRAFRIAGKIIRDEWPTRHELTLCCATREISERLFRWIDHHERLGAGRLMVYLTGPSAPSSRRELMSREGGRIGVECTSLESHSQLLARAVETIGAESKWLGLLDVGEYLCYRGEGSLNRGLRTFDRAAGLLVWPSALPMPIRVGAGGVNFGELPSPVTDQLGEKPVVIVQPRRVRFDPSSGLWYGGPGVRFVDEKRRPSREMRLESRSANEFQVWRMGSPPAFGPETGPVFDWEIQGANVRGNTLRISKKDRKRCARPVKS